jgi:hypothetical protein
MTHMRKPSDLTRALALAAALVLPGIARAQDPIEDTGPPFRPSNDQLNDELDETLQQEYDEAHPPPPAEPTPPPPPPPDEGIRFRLGGLASHYYAIARDVTVYHRDGTSGGLPVDLDDGDAVADFEPRHLQNYRMWIDLGKHVSFEGGYRRSMFRDERAIAQGFTFGRTAFTTNETVNTSIDTLTADLDLVVKPVNNRWVEIGLHLGTRYMFWRTELKSAASALRRETSTLEAAVPIVGASLAIRPVRPLELFVRGRVGYLEYDRPESAHYHNGRLRTIEAKDKEAKTCELDAGISVTIDETIGVVVGYRLDYLRIEREVDDRSEGVKGTVHGIYAGVILEF